MEADVSPFGNQSYVYAGVPPVTNVLMAPSEPPLHETFWSIMAKTDGSSNTEMDASAEAVQPAAV